MGASHISLLRRAPIALPALLILLLALVLGACEDTPEDMQSPEPGAKGRSPFTGLEGRNGPVLGVKIDNAAAARPHTGLGQADIVYVERVEAGLSRLLAVFSSRLPKDVGPVRSARESDLELLEQFGKPALAYSGAQSKLQPVIEDAPLYPVGPSDAGGAWFRGQEKPAPHNLFVRPKKALAAAPDADAAKDIGFRFGTAPKGGKATGERTVSFPAARFGFTWSAQQERWLVSLDGQAASTTAGKRLPAATVVVQQVKIRDSGFGDRWGNVSPYTETTGEGRAEVLRDGRSYDVTWERTSADSGTEFTTKDGERFPFARGPVWVVLTGR